MRKCLILTIQKPLDKSSKVLAKTVDVKEWVRTKTGRFNEGFPIYKNLVSGDEIYDCGENYVIFSTGSVEAKKTIKKFMEKCHAENS